MIKRNPHLDGLRGLAVVMVLLWHYLGCQITPQHTPSLMWLREIVSMMWSGVDLFFVLSGFLITGILKDHRESPRYWSNFYLRRSCRILPLYAILTGSYALALACGAQNVPGLWWLFFIPMPLLSYVTFTQNFFMAAAGGTGANWMGVSWSLAVEEQFYLVLPLVVYLLRPRWLPAVLAAAVLAAPVLRALFPGNHVIFHMPFKLDALALGGLLALLVREPRLLAAFAARPRPLKFLLGLLVVTWVAMTFHLPPFENPNLLTSSYSAFTYLLLACLFATLLLLALVAPHEKPFHLLAHPVLVWFGAVSYFTYLFHQLISALLHYWLRSSTPLLESWPAAGVTLLALLCTLGLAELSRRYFEAPILRWSHRRAY